MWNVSVLLEEWRKSVAAKWILINVLIFNNVFIFKVLNSWWEFVQILD